MKTLFVKSERYVCDECGAGEPAHLRLCCSIFLAGAYCRKQGLNIDVQNVPTEGRDSITFDDYDVVVSWVALLEGFYDGIRYLEKANKEGKITVMVLNDPFDGLELEVMEKYQFIDYTIRLYERELVLGELLKELQNGKKDIDFTGIIYRDGLSIVDNGKRPPLDSLEHLPSTVEFLKTIDLSRYEHIFLESGRGCPCSCTFCFYRKTKPRKRKIRDLLSELDVVVGKVDHIWLHDLNMLANRKWTEQLCDEIIKSGIKAKWSTDIRMDQCIKNIDLLKKMHDAGCHLVAIGIESADSGILEKIKKNVPIDNIDEAIKNCLTVGIEPSLNIMVGFPWETNNTLKKIKNILFKYSRISFEPQFVRPLRGTPLYEEYKKLGLLTRDLTVDDYVSARVKPLFPSLFLSKKELMEWNHKLEEIIILKTLKSGNSGYWIKVAKKFIKERDFRKYILMNYIRFIRIVMHLVRVERVNKKEYKK
ncbi:B12-binding domain-containing radical SAM protein [candidate division WOR-3 bacterium]|nr:B12-binding domain-containing radical SAM protein [candidate division WOR-3 bacterium]